jgi:hypothetical protein
MCLMTEMLDMFHVSLMIVMAVLMLAYGVIYVNNFLEVLDDRFLSMLFL